MVRSKLGSHPRPPMRDIAEWLEKLGMSEYAQRLAENGMGFAALRHLTDQDLKDIGVLLGQRRIILAAIQDLGSPAAAQRAAAELKPQEFSDLVGSTALSAHGRRGFAEVISAYQKCVAETVQRARLVQYRPHRGLGDSQSKFRTQSPVFRHETAEASAQVLLRRGRSWWRLWVALKTHAPLSNARRHRNVSCGRRRASSLSSFAYGVSRCDQHP